MSKTGIDLPSQTVVLSLENAYKAEPGFIKDILSHAHPVPFAKALASAFLKVTTQGKQLSQVESVQNFIALAELHRSLTEQAQAFLQEEVAFVYQDQQLQPLLLNFAAYRLKRASRQFYFAVLQHQSASEQEALKTAIRQCQNEYDALLQQV